jgi:hypothetical protein
MARAQRLGDQFTPGPIAQRSLLPRPVAYEFLRLNLHDPWVAPTLPQVKAMVSKMRSKRKAGF